MKEEKRTIRVGLLGIGTVGSGVAAVLKENADSIRDRCAEIKLTHIVSRDQAKAQKVIDELGLVGVKWSADYHALVEDDSLDIVVEVAGGIPMPKDFIMKALKHGKTVVTANKDLMAAHGHELMELAEENGVDIFFEASVCGGIPILQAIQKEYRYLPEEALCYVAKKLHVGEAKIYSIATFYENFSLEPKGKYVIKCCDGTACHVRKSIPILEYLRGELGLSEKKTTTDDLMFTVETVSCLGACGLAPVLTVNDVVHPEMNPDKAAALLKELREKEAE